MKLYRKKPIIIKAIQYLREDNLSECMNFCDKMVFLPDHNEYGIATLEGVMIISAGDFIISGVNGEFYPCKPDIFTKTYDEIDYTDGKEDE